MSQGKTTAQKIFKAHTVDVLGNIRVIKLDKVFCHEITTPTAIEDLVASNMDEVFDSSRIKAVIDHVSPAKDGKTAFQGKILRDWAKRHGITDFFDIGENGVCHAIFPEKGFVRPGETIIMGDSHTCTHGAFCAFAAGVGTTDLEVGTLKGICAFHGPDSIRVMISGSLKPGVYAKDVILALIGKIGVNGATGKILEFAGPVISAMSMDERMTICNMAVEAGATCGICPADTVTVDYLWPFISGDYPDKNAALNDFSKWNPDNNADYSETVNLDVTDLSPQVTFGQKPDCVKPATQLKGTSVDQVYIGSCTNGRLSDLEAAAKELKGRKVSGKVRAILAPATTGIYKQALEIGILKTFSDAGFCIVSPGCGACLGMSNGVLAPGEVCASTTNRNFNGRMGKGGTVHLMSPATAAASAIAGEIACNSLYLEAIQ